MSPPQLTLLQTGGARAMPNDGARIEGDAYYTSPRLARSIVSEVQRFIKEPIDGVVLEPSVGGGAFATAILDLTPARLMVADIDPTAPGMATGWWSRRRAAGERYPLAFYTRQSFLDLDHLRPGWVIGNPPYADALAHVEHALAIAPRVVFLLRLAFTESIGRIGFWKTARLRHLWVLAKRPSFTASGKTDACPYAVFFWDRDHVGEPTMTPCWDWQGVSR